MSNHAYRPPKRWKPSLSNNAIEWSGAIIFVSLGAYITEHYGLADKWMIGIVLMSFPSMIMLTLYRSLWSRKSFWIAMIVALPLQILVVILVFALFLAPFNNVAWLFWYPFALLESSGICTVIAAMEKKLHRRQQTHRTWHGI